MYGYTDLPLNMTFDWLFDRVRQEDVYEKYLGFCDLNSKYCNPLRNDSDPGCSFYWHNGILFFKDFAYKTYTCVSVVMEVERLSYNKALWKIYDTFIKKENLIVSLPKSDIRQKTKEYVKYEVQIQNFTDLDKRFLKSCGITGEFCRKAKWYSVKFIISSNTVKYGYTEYDPCIGYYFGKGRWKFYFYKRKNYRFLTNAPSKIIQGIELIEDNLEYLIITKSFKDIGTLYRYGIPSVSPQAESIVLSKDQMSSLKSKAKKIYTLSDYDNAGIHFAWEMRKRYDTIPLFLTEGLWKRKKGFMGAKDISDYYYLHGDNKTKQLIQNEKSKIFYSVEEH
jgi:hypothetical protein